jgi:hypothetical protein
LCYPGSHKTILGAEEYMSYEISLFKLVENRDASLYGRLIDIRKKAEPLLSYTQGKFPY